LREHLRRWFERRLHDSATADDLTQEVVLRLWCSATAGTPDSDHLQRLAHVTASHLLADEHRRRARRREVALAFDIAAKEGSDRTDPRRAELETMRPALECVLTRAQHIALALYLDDGVAGIGALATCLHIPAGNARRRLAAIGKKIAHCTRA
jgi:RNA polymerase sigma factor (sigma-70 family)